MYKNVIGLFALCFTLLGTASSVQAQPRPRGPAPTPGAHVATPPTPNNDVSMDDVPQPLMCGAEDICVVQERHSALIGQHQAALAALQAQVARLAAAPSVRPAPRPAARPSATPIRTPIVRIRAIEVGLDDLGGRFEAVVRDLPGLIALQAQCALRQNNPALRVALPPGTDCDQVSRDIQAAQAMAARSSPLARPAGRPTP